MMTPCLKKLYIAAKKDKAFITTFEQAGNDKIPNKFSSDLDRISFTAIFYGDLLSIYGNDWEAQI